MLGLFKSSRIDTIEKELVKQAQLINSVISYTEHVANFYVKENVEDASRKFLLFYKSRDVTSPNRGTADSAGFDFFVPNDYIDQSNGVWNEGLQEYVLNVLPNSSVNIPSGIHVKLPSRNWVLVAFNKSGVSIKKHMLVGACVIDYDYQGEIHINVHNVGPTMQVVRNGDKLTQFLLLSTVLNNAVEVGTLQDLYSGLVTERGTGMAGSTGTNVSD